VQQVYANACSAACAYGQNWNCVGHVVYPATNVTSITEASTLLDYTTGMPVQRVDVCISYDCATCGTPGQNYATTQTGINGFYTATLQLPAISAFGGTGPSFEGCFRTSSSNTVTAWGYMGFPQTEATWNVGPAYSMTMSTPGEMATLLTAVGVPEWDSSRAIVSMRVLDCLGTPAPGVQVAINTQDPETTVWLSGASSATSASAINNNSTNDTGLAAFFNVPAPDAGFVNVALTATPMSLGKVSSYKTVGVQAGINSQVEMPPTPPATP
jgi:hypothetical protein